MAYTRGHFYAFESISGFMEIHHGWDHEHEPDCPIEKKTGTSSVYLPVEYFEELCAMYWAQMTSEEQEAAKTRAITKWGGNFGVDGLLREAGQPTLMEQIVEELDA